MPNIHETAYPRLKSGTTEKDLDEIYAPDLHELLLAASHVRGPKAKACFLIQLKTFQRLGYFAFTRDVPKQIVSYLARSFETELDQQDLARYDGSGSRQRHIAVIKEHLDIRSFDDTGKSALGIIMQEAAMTKDDLADIINVGIEELVRLRFELPGFTVLLRSARHARATVNRHLHAEITNRLTKRGRRCIDQILNKDESAQYSSWQRLKLDSGKPTLKNLQQLVDQLHWLQELNMPADAFNDIPDAKIRKFAAEAKSLDAARMREMEPTKRYALSAALIRMQTASRLDDLATMFLKQIKKIHHKAQEELDNYRAEHQSRVDKLLGVLHELLMALQESTTPKAQIMRMKAVVGESHQQLIEECKSFAAYADNNYAPFLWKFYKSHRKTFFSVFKNVCLVSTSQDASIQQAWEFTRHHHDNKSDWIDASTLDLSWVSDKWWKLVTGKANRTTQGDRISRRHFEMCVFSQIALELKSGDLCIPGSDEFSDYRKQLISWDEYNKTISGYSELSGLSVESPEFIAHLRRQLEAIAHSTDQTFPTNDAVRIENGEPFLTKIEAKIKSPAVVAIERLIAEELEGISIVDVLADTESWHGWTRNFGPLSGFDGKLDRARERYVATVFCYGCGLGPTQTARSLEFLDRRQIGWINQRHITEEKIDKAIVQIINAYNRFALPRLWGSGKSAAADGTKWDLYEQNLLSEYHIRYGGYGGIGYYHVSDTYIALFSHFIPCGVWEAVYILDGLLNNKSDIQPDTLHADTQGQSTPVFGLSYLLGINLMPRIRNWKDLKLFRPSKHARYEHIDALFSDTIDWDLIQTHLPDLFRVVLSIKAGRISASTILRKLGTYSRKNKLYQAMSELGRAVRTIFLLKYISDLQLRSTIQTATNKIEAFNGFTKWVSFGNDATIVTNDRDEQRKLIKYNHLVANCLIFHTVANLTRVVHKLAARGFQVTDEVLAHISPYMTEHVNRFGKYTLTLERESDMSQYQITLFEEAPEPLLTDSVQAEKENNELLPI